MSSTEQPIDNIPNAATPVPVLPAANDEMIVYVQSVSPLKKNKRGTLDYADVTLQLEGNRKRRRAVCFSQNKQQLLLKRSESKTAMKLAKFNFAKDGMTLFINDQTSLSTPPPDEYSFQFEETISLTANSSLKDVLELSEPMQLVDIKAKIIYLSEVQIVTRKQLTMVEAMISDGKTTARLVLWEDQARNVQKEIFLTSKN